MRRKLESRANATLAKKHSHLAGGVGVYFGGDLTEWIWPDMEAAAVGFTENDTMAFECGA